MQTEREHSPCYTASLFLILLYTILKEVENSVTLLFPAMIGVGSLAERKTHIKVTMRKTSICYFLDKLYKY